MKKLKQLFRKFHNKNQGLTLVEMIVTFMLIGLFMIAASKVIANTVSVYYTAKGTANGMQVSSIIASKIRGEIEGARDATITTEVKNEDGTGFLTNIKDIETGYNKIEFTDAQGSHVYIGVNEEGYLVVHYYPVVVASGEVKSTDWVFDQKAYMGYSIKELKFTQPKGDYADNIIYMSLTLHSSRYGDFTYTEYIQCYNLDANSDTQINCKTE